MQTTVAFGDEVFDPPTISNPNLFTSHSSVPDVDQSTGAFVHRVPLDIPPGRNGLTPDLALQYNSQQLDDGIVAYGWSLSLPYIERFNRTGIDRLYTDNYFTSSLGNVNGDGLIDYVVSLPFIDGNMPSNGTHLHLGTSTASWQLATSTFSPVAELPSSGTSQERVSSWISTATVSMTG